MTRWFPVWTLAMRKTRECARLTAEIRRLRAEIVDVRVELAAATALLALARNQARRALDLATATDWSADDVEFCHEIGVEVER